MNNQQIGKIINFFRINHEFQPPFTFLVDGNFLKLLIQKQISFEEKLKSFLPGKFRVKITSCIVNELSLLGHEFMIVHQMAQKIQQVKCHHSIQSADMCIKDHVKNFNQAKIIICTQDQVLRRKIRRFSVPIMYFGPDQRITMQDVERHNLQKVQEEIKVKMLPKQNQMLNLAEYNLQQQIIQKEKKKREEIKIASEKGLQLKNIKVRKAKGPNPLSMKKKKTVEQQEQPQKKKRIRKRKKKIQ